jgi:hypothetical protein
MRGENAAVGRARKRKGRGQDAWRSDREGDGEEEEDEKKGGAGETDCRLHLLSMGEGVPTVFKYPRLSDPSGRDKVVVHEKAQK